MRASSGRAREAALAVEDGRFVVDPFGRTASHARPGFVPNANPSVSVNRSVADGARDVKAVAARGSWRRRQASRRYPVTITTGQ